MYNVQTDLVQTDKKEEEIDADSERDDTLCIMFRQI
jgi:hypothetical protein